jgi:hypothetical protein
MQSAKAKIKKIVETYIKLSPEEVAVFKQYMQQRRGGMVDDRFGLTEGSKDMRALIELPVALHEMITNGLAADELEWFKSGGASKNEGSRWFAKTFPLFTLPSHI